ncbi:tyrosinase [Colletotrichum plurivorum]|uniref:tyrosinase n=1 Tax=Colletotrichum plurivorum TaxID=2175906 RepID=A0A8H6K2X5_9PEZI|nr:tyrosinase [Colletotrichum plurivorum]
MGGTITRKNIRKLTRPELDDLVRAFIGIQQLPPDDPNSFFVIAGYHGEPFRGAGYSNPAWWGGYCNHGNVLFPTWHRAYLLRLEKALQSQVPGVALPYWDETEEATLKDGIPGIFLERYWTFDGEVNSVPNPLFSYKFQARITDRLTPIPDANYTKPVGYETVRYPFSGLVGTPLDAEGTFIHNQTMKEMGESVTNQMLNDNITTWMNSPTFLNSDKEEVKAGVKDKYHDCLNAPNYTVFSNTTSAERWNDDHLSEEGNHPVVPLESPHNSIHLAVGGFELPNLPPPNNFNRVSGANGDMGENDTAAFDPIFFFHHCFVDLMFWRWQVKHKSEDSLEIIPGYPGTNSVDSQGPTPGVAGGTWLTIDSPLAPFTKPNDATTVLTSRDLVNINKLGYTYDSPEPPRAAPPSKPSPILAINDVYRSDIGGSFLISAWANLETGEKVLVGTEAVLSRWHVAGCQNCQNHLEVRAHIPIKGFTQKQFNKLKFEVGVHTRTRPNGAKEGSGPLQTIRKPSFRVITDHL